MDKSQLKEKIKELEEKRHALVLYRTRLYQDIDNSRDEIRAIDDQLAPIYKQLFKK